MEFWVWLHEVGRNRTSGTLPLAEDDSESKWNVGGGAGVGSHRQI